MISNHALRGFVKCSSSVSRRPSLCYRHTNRIRSLAVPSKSSTSSPSWALSSSTSASTSEIAALRDEVKALKELIEQSNAQSKETEVMVKNIESKLLTKIETSLEEIHENIISHASTVERITSSVSKFVSHNEALNKITDQINKITGQTYRYVNKYTIGCAVVAVIGIVAYRSYIYDSTSQEIADLAARTLEQAELRQSIQETLTTIANSSDTLDTLNDLLQKVIRDPATLNELVNLIVYSLQTPDVQNTLLKLLEFLFTDPFIQKLTGEFLLKSLDEKEVKKMLEEQTQDLVRHTVLDESVQRATSVGVQRSIWYALIPPIFCVSSSSSSSNRDDQNDNDNNDDNNLITTTDEAGITEKENDSVENEEEIIINIEQSI